MTSLNVNGQILMLEQFNLDKLVYKSSKDKSFLNPRICIIAKSNSGKSWVIREIMKRMNDIPAGVIIAPTDRLNKFYDSIYPPSFIHHEYKPEIMERLLKRQDMIIDKNQKRIKDGKKSMDTRVLFIMDDCMSAKKQWAEDPNFLSIMNEGRHRHINYILSMQYSLGILPEYRSQFNFIFLLAEDMRMNRKKLYEHYAGMFPSFELFESVFLQMTQNYGCMVIDNSSRSIDLKERIFYFKAHDIKDFAIGNNRFIEFDEKNFDPKHGKKPNIFDVNDYMMRRKTNILVKVNRH
jgi:hypothetical protein